ncbi:MAG: methyltransferase domain-containing protein [Parcubacteria group bacterium]
MRLIVLNELHHYPDLHIIKEAGEFVYLDLPKHVSCIRSLRSATRAYIIAEDHKYNPHYISNHKSIVGDILAVVMRDQKNAFRSFKLICAGSTSFDARSIAEYIHNTFQLAEAEDADLKAHIIKTKGTWEVGVQLTPRPLSSRDYKLRNMGGAMDPTIAYAVNSLADLGGAESYLNVFSGSATLLIEAAQCFPNLKKLLGFDNNKETISLAMQNIREAGVIRRVRLKEKDIFDKPDFGTFDVITSDLPFGMLIAKHEDLENLYRAFVTYCQGTLRPGGRLVIYTSEHKLLKKILAESLFGVQKTFELKLMTSANMYLHPKIFVCTFK